MSLLARLSAIEHGGPRRDLIYMFSENEHLSDHSWMFVNSECCSEYGMEWTQHIQRNEETRKQTNMYIVVYLVFVTGSVLYQYIFHKLVVSREKPIKSFFRAFYRISF